MKNNTENETNNVIEFAKPRRHNITLIIFLLLLIYLLVIVIIYSRTTHMKRYQVVEGSLTNETQYTGIALRDEILVSTSTAGYVNFIAREGQRVSVGDLVYLVDESGSLNEYLESRSLGENTLTDKELADFRSEIINFEHSYDSKDFNSVYDFKYSLKNTVSKLASTKLLDNMNVSEATGLSFEYCYSPYSGIVSYWYDDLMNLSDSEICQDCFEEKNHQKTQILSNELRGTGEDIYKINLSENWSIVFPADEEKAAELLEEDYILVKFLKDQNEVWGKVSVLNNSDGTYVKLTFSNSMLNYCDERYLNVELELNNETGLKIPISSIAEKEFFLIDDNYITEDEKENYTVLMETYDDSGNKTASSKTLEVYYYDENLGVYYVDDSVLSLGDVLFGSDQTTFVVSKRGTLTGVYNINKGYADFKQITILYENEDYAIVKSNTAYGLRAYDYIALESESVDDDEFISQSN